MSTLSAWRPRRAELVDAGFLLVATILALLAWDGTFAGVGYLVVGGAGAVLGIALAHVASVTRVPWVLVLPALAVGYFVLGGAIALSGDPDASWLPTPGTWTELAHLATRGWLELLTTLPPLDADSPLLALPLIVGLVVGGLGATLAGRVAAAGAPLVVVALGLVSTILLGTRDPGLIRVVGVGSAVVALVWAAVRSRRRIVHGGRAPARLVTGVVVLAAGVAAGAFAGPLLPGGDPHGRTVLRSSVVPPLDLSAFPSPLVGFRKYRPVTRQFADRELFAVHGLPAGTRVRIATLDDYDGRVWTVRNAAPGPATGRSLDTFQRIGRSVAAPVGGTSRHATITIAGNYADQPDTNGWLPDVGQLTAVRFHGKDGAQLAGTLRYNLATGTAVVPARLRAGTTYSLSAVQPTAPTTLPRDAEPGGSVALDPGVFSFVQRAVATWTAKTSGGAWDQALAIADHLRAGAYTDGGPGAGQFLPGHGMGRLTAFLGAPQLVGDDEQYAAAFALMANAVGVPARVVVGAVTGSSDAVRGRDIHAWVEVRLAGRGWLTVPTERFTPPVSHKPKVQRIERDQNSDASVVPPPNAVRPPSALDQLAQSSANSSRREPHPGADGSGWQLPAFVRAALVWGGPPVGLVLLFVVTVLVAKAVRRRRRRTAGPVPRRVAAGWREVVDQARDLGLRVLPVATRVEQARELDRGDLLPLAHDADRALFAATPPDAGVVADIWVQVAHARRDMLLGVGRWRRWRARLSVRSLRPARTG